MSLGGMDVYAAQSCFYSALKVHTNIYVHPLTLRCPQGFEDAIEELSEADATATHQRQSWQVMWHSLAGTACRIVAKLYRTVAWNGQQAIPFLGLLLRSNLVLSTPSRYPM